MGDSDSGEQLASSVNTSAIAGAQQSAPTTLCTRIGTCSRHVLPSSTLPLCCLNVRTSLCRQASVGWVHAVVIDAGSTGSRVHVYKYYTASSNSPWATVDLPGAVYKTTPGLSSYGFDPRTAANSLKPLLKFAKQKVTKLLAFAHRPHHLQQVTGTGQPIALSFPATAVPCKSMVAARCSSLDVSCASQCQVLQPRVGCLLENHHLSGSVGLHSGRACKVAVRSRHQQLDFAREQ